MTTPGKRSDECLFCTRRRCHVRIRSDLAGYDEVACTRHTRELGRHYDERHVGTMMTHTTSTGRLRRGDRSKRARLRSQRAETGARVLPGEKSD